MATLNLKKCYDLKLDGNPEKKIVEISAPEIVSINPQVFNYIKPKVVVKDDDSVKFASLLFFD